MNTAILREIGLTEGESKAYFALLRLGSTTIGPLTDEAQVSRSKIYHILERLINKGLASYIIKNKTKYFQGADPDQLQKYLDEKEKDFQEQRKKINDFLPQLKAQQKNALTPKEVQVYEGFKGLQTAHEHIYSILRKGDELFYLGIPSFQEEKYHSYWNKDLRRATKLGIRSKSLFSNGTSRKIMENRNSFKAIDARYMPIDIN